MPQLLSYINDVTPDSSSWSVKILVESKGLPEQSKHSPTKFQRLTLVDEVGTKVAAVIFNKEIERYANTLLAYETYIVSNARVTLANPRFDSLGSKYTWILSQRTVVTKVLDNVISRSIIIPKFHDFHSLQPSEDRQTVDILAIVIKNFNQRTVATPSRSYIIHEFGLLNEEQRPIILTLWNNLAIAEGQLLVDFAEPMPIIMATKLTVTHHYGVSLGSTPTTSIVVDPPIPESEGLKIWRANSFDAIKKAQLQLDDVIKMQLSSMQPTGRLQTVANVARGKDDDRFSLRVSIEVRNMNQRFFYIACEKCYSSYDAESDWEFDCRKCNQKTTGKPREMVFINIIDETGSMRATVFAEDAVKVINMNAAMAMEMYNAGKLPSIDELNAYLKNRKYLIKVKKTTLSRHDSDLMHCTVQKLVEDEHQDIVAAVSCGTSLIEKAVVPDTPQIAHARKRLLFSDEESPVEDPGVQKKSKDKSQADEFQYAPVENNDP